MLTLTLIILLILLGMINKMKTSKQVEQELEEEKNRYKYLQNRKVELEKELKEIEQELRGYMSSSWSWGKIKYKEQELKTIKLIEESEYLPKPILHLGDENDKYRIFKVTPKRIYIRTIDKERAIISEDFINKDGSDCWKFRYINITETLKVWEDYLDNGTDK